MNKKLDEFAQISKHKNFLTIILQIFKEIEFEGCNISARYDTGPSIHEFSEKGRNCLIRIPIKEFVNRPSEAIWTILHEFGHHMSGNISKNKLNEETILMREKEAWDFARKYILNIQELHDNIEQFEIYAEKCLKSYYQYFNR